MELKYIIRMLKFTDPSYLAINGMTLNPDLNYAKIFDTLEQARIRAAQWNKDALATVFAVESTFAGWRLRLC